MTQAPLRGGVQNDYDTRAIDQPLSTWRERKLASIALARVFSDAAVSVPQAERWAERVAGCCDMLALREGPAGWYLARGSFCGVRLCPLCQWRRSRIWIARLQAALHPDALPGRLLFLTLTVRNCEVENLRSTLDRISKGWSKLRRRAEWPATGYLRSVEITRGADGTAHPHTHAILHVPSGYFGRAYLKQERWRDLWRDCAGLTYDPVIDVRTVKGKPLEAVLELAKYTVKRADLVNNPDWTIGVAQAIHRTRAVAVGGDVSDLLTDADDDPATSLELDPDAPPADPINDGNTRWARWDRGGYRQC